MNGDYKDDEEEEGTRHWCWQPFRNDLASTLDSSVRRTFSIEASQRLCWGMVEHCTPYMVIDGVVYKA